MDRKTRFVESQFKLVMIGTGIAFFGGSLMLGICLVGFLLGDEQAFGGDMFKFSAVLVCVSVLSYFFFKLIRTDVLTNMTKDED